MYDYASRTWSSLSELIESVRKAIRAGQNLDEAIAATPLGQQYTQDIAGSDPPLVAQFAAFGPASIAGTCGGPTKG